MDHSSPSSSRSPGLRHLIEVMNGKADSASHLVELLGNLKPEEMQEVIHDYLLLPELLDVCRSMALHLAVRAKRTPSLSAVLSKATAVIAKTNPFA